MKCARCNEDIWPRCLCSATGVDVLRKVGRPPGSIIPPDKKKRNFTTKLGPEWFMFLEEMKTKGHSKAWCINKGLELLRAHLSG